MAKIENNVTVTVDVGTSKAVYTAPVAEIAGWSAKGFETLGITLRNYKRESLTAQLVRNEGALCDPPEDEERKKLIAAHASNISEKLQQAETSRLQEEAMRIEREAEAALQKARSRRKIMIAVHAAIQAGLSVEDVTAGMEDGFAGYVHDMFDQVYVLTDLDTVVNVD